ncbi:MAG: hypothetical protein ABWU84_04350 [Pyrobaculum sp.]|uniref:hypothetical protein n=1 Tax=Pyrobaculum sp. TaxID=2004705 RepID=UPI003EEE4D77
MAVESKLTAGAAALVIAIVAAALYITTTTQGALPTEPLDTPISKPPPLLVLYAEIFNNTLVFQIRNYEGRPLTIKAVEVADKTVTVDCGGRGAVAPANDTVICVAIIQIDAQPGTILPGRVVVDNATAEFQVLMVKEPLYTK